MEKQLVQPFIDAACAVLDSEAAMMLRPLAVAMVRSPLPCRDLTVVIGVAGDLHGVVALNVSDCVAATLVQRMSGGIDVAQDDMRASAMGELGNMVAGRAAMKLAGLGRQVVLSPPTILTTSSESTLSLAGSIYGILLGGDAGNLELDIAFTPGRAR